MAGFLRNFRRELAQIASPGVRRDLAAEGSRRFARLIDEGFERERDPYGVLWQPSKKSSGKTLTKTGQLRQGLFVESDPRGRRVTVRITGTARRYGPIHQEGRGRMPQRRFMPDGQGLPPAWGREFTQAADDYFQRRWGR